MSSSDSLGLTQLPPNQSSPEAPTYVKQRRLEWVSDAMQKHGKMSSFWNSKNGNVARAITRPCPRKACSHQYHQPPHRRMSDTCTKEGQEHSSGEGHPSTSKAKGHQLSRSWNSRIGRNVNSSACENERFKSDKDMLAAQSGKGVIPFYCLFEFSINQWHAAEVKPMDPVHRILKCG